MSRRSVIIVWIVAVLGFAAFLLVCWLLPPYLYRDVVNETARVGAITAIRAALLAGLVGLGALGTFWVNGQTLKVTERGHITDRYTKAIEQLGSDKLDVRLGGIYALEQLAEDSARARDQATVVEVLSAFVRVHSQKNGFAALHDDVGVPYAITVDMQAAVTVLGRLPYRAGIVRADLDGAVLPRVNLFKADLRTASLFETDLREANLAEADLSDADLTLADLERARLHDAKLVRATLKNARLRRADFARADLTRADLTQAILSNASFVKANLQHAQTGVAEADDVDFDGASGVDPAALAASAAALAIRPLPRRVRRDPELFDGSV